MAPLAVASGLACNVPSFTVQRKITSWSKTTQQKTTIFLHIYFFYIRLSLFKTRIGTCDVTGRRETRGERSGKREEGREKRKGGEAGSDETVGIPKQI